MHPGDPDGHGRYGYLDGDDERVICHECGRGYRSLAAHVHATHGMTVADYRAAHGLPRGLPLVSPAISRAKSEQSRARIGTQAWEKLVAKRDPTAASRARTAESHARRGLDAEKARTTALANISGQTKPHTRICRTCGEYPPRKGATYCSELCKRIGRLTTSASQRNADWHHLREDGLTLTEIGARYGVSHTAVRVGIRRHLERAALIEQLAKRA